MSRAPKNLTIIIIADNKIARIDARVSDEVEILRQKSVHADGAKSLAQQVRTAVRLVDSNCGDIWVVSSRFWTGVVELERDVFEAVSEDQLSLAIALEAEFDSGLSPFESAIGFAVCNDSKNGGQAWSVVQGTLEDIEQIKNSLGRNHRHLLGFAAIPNCVDDLLLVVDDQADAMLAEFPEVCGWIYTLANEGSASRRTVPVLLNRRKPISPQQSRAISLCAI